MSAIKGQDIVVLLKLVSLENQLVAGESDRVWVREDQTPYSARSLEDQLGVSKSEAHAAIRRSLSSGLAIRDRNRTPRVNRRNLFDFIVHGLRFVFPATPGAMTRGIPTAFAAPMLEGLLMSAGQYNYVWPDARGRSMGQAVEPLFKSVPQAVEKDARLYEYLALVDAVRLGKPREVGLARDRLSEALLP